MHGKNLYYCIAIFAQTILIVLASKNLIVGARF